MALPMKALYAVRATVLIPIPSEWPLVCSAYWSDAVRETASSIGDTKSIVDDSAALSESVPIPRCVPSAAVAPSVRVFAVGASCVSRVAPSASVDDRGSVKLNVAPASLCRENASRVSSLL